MMSKTFSRNLSFDHHMQILFVVNGSEIITDVIVREVMTCTCRLKIDAIIMSFLDNWFTIPLVYIFLKSL